MRDTSKRSRGLGWPILLGGFMALLIITAWEVASDHVDYSLNTGVDSNDGSIRARIQEGRWRLAIDSRGKIEIAPDERSILRLAPDASLDIEERNRRDRRRLEVRPGPGGEPEMTWFVDRKQVDVDDATHDWLARMLPRIYRATGLDAEARVGRLLAAGGLAEVLQEIDKIGGDSIQKIYVEHLMEQSELSGDELERVLRGMSRQISSDHQLAGLLADIPAGRLADPATANAFLAATKTIGSDHELGRLLSAHLESTGLGAEGFETFLDAAMTIGSDFEMAELLGRLAAAMPEDQQLPTGYARAVESIGSDFEQRKALRAAFERPGLSAGELERLLRAAGQIGSDFELAELLVELSRSYTGELPDAYFRLFPSIGSDYELYRVLSATVARPGLDPETVVALLEASTGIASDHQLAGFLIELNEAYPIDDEVRSAFDHAMGTVGASYERERVRKAAERGAATRG